MHQNKGKTIADCLAKRTDYAKNPEKTSEGELLSAYECDPRTVQAEFLLTKRKYEDITGRKQKKNVIAYQIRQAFKPDEVTPEQAMQIGYELGMRFTKGKHAFIVATHVDKAHIHNHIIFNSTSLDATGKFRNFLGSGKALAKLSDYLCLAHGLSIIANPKRSKRHYGKWLGDEKPLSHSETLRQTIEVALAQKPKTFDDFLQLMQAAGYEIKQGKHIAFKGAAQKNFIRLRSLGSGYLEEDLRAVIRGEVVQRTVKARVHRAKKEVNLLQDIDAIMQSGKGKGYEQWAKVFNAKQMAQTINYLREHNLMDYAALSQKAEEVTQQFHALNTNLKASEARIAAIQVMRTHIINYAKTREVYEAYRKSGYAQTFYAAHEQELLLRKAAKAAFSEIDSKKLPTVKELNAELDALFAAKKSGYAEYRKAKKEMQELLTAKANVDRLLGGEGTEKQKEKAQDPR